MTAALTPLSPRELDVLRLASQGLTNAEIGLSLGTVESTVKTQIEAAMRRLGARNRAHAVALMDDRFEGWRDTSPVGPALGSQALAALLRAAADALEMAPSD